MRQFLLAGVSVVMIAIVAAPDVSAAPLSKRYEFKGGVTLEMAVAAESGLRLDTIRFHVPTPDGERLLGVDGTVTARVAVSNTADRPFMVGLAIALYDDEGHLLGVASGGNLVTAVKPNRQQTFNLVFEGLNSEAHKAKTFQIGLEAKP